MSPLTWNLFGLIVGAGLIFTTDFKSIQDYIWKALGVFMVFVSFYKLAALLE